MNKIVAFIIILLPPFIYGQTVSVAQSWILPDSISETSGLQFVNNRLITFNDDTDTLLYALDTLGEIVSTVPLKGVSNQDWEDIAQNSEYLFIGDFGNNSSGNRQDLHILRILKSSIIAEPIVDTIFFTYEDQMDYTPMASNTTNFDCEAMIATEDSLYLFTKQWGNLVTTCYSLPLDVGMATAKNKGTFDCNGLITGADYIENDHRLVLCGYSESLQPFLLLFSNFSERHFFQGQTLKVGINLSFHQVEGITALDENNWYISNEAFNYQGVITILPAIHKINLQTLWNVGIENPKPTKGISIRSCEPTNRCLHLSLVEDSQIIVFTEEGRIIYDQSFPAGEHEMSMNPGLVFIRINSNNFDFGQWWMTF